MGGAAKPRGEAVVADAEPHVLDLDTYVPALVHHIANKLSTGANALYKRAFGVGLTEWTVLALLANEPGSTAQRICEVIGLDKALVSRVVKSLRARDLISTAPDASDSRKINIALTDAGRDLHDAILPAAMEREARLLKGLSRAEVSALRSALQHVHRNIPAANLRIKALPGGKDD